MKKYTADAGHSWFGSVDRKPGAREVESSNESFGRLWRAFMAARVTIPSVLLDEAARLVCMDWARQNATEAQLRVQLGAARVSLLFEAEHLRRLIVNLLDNALRYASRAVGAIQLTTEVSASGQTRLSIWSDGQPLEKTVQSHLFEPFFSSESRSSGLGLYICRELCERHGALIGYQRLVHQAIDGNTFFITFRSAGGGAGADSALAPADKLSATLEREHP